MKRGIVVFLLVNVFLVSGVLAAIDPIEPSLGDRPSLDCETTLDCNVRVEGTDDYKLPRGACERVSCINTVCTFVNRLNGFECDFGNGGSCYEGECIECLRGYHCANQPAECVQGEHPSLNYCAERECTKDQHCIEKFGRNSMKTHCCDPAYESCGPDGDYTCVEEVDDSLGSSEGERDTYVSVHRGSGSLHGEGEARFGELTLYEFILEGAAGQKVVSEGLLFPNTNVRSSGGWTMSLVFRPISCSSITSSDAFIDLNKKDLDRIGVIEYTKKIGPVAAGRESKGEFFLTADFGAEGTSEEVCFAIDRTYMFSLGQESDERKSVQVLRMSLEAVEGDDQVAGACQGSYGQFSLISYFSGACGDGREQGESG